MAAQRVSPAYSARNGGNSSAYRREARPENRMRMVTDKYIQRGYFMGRGFKSGANLGKTNRISKGRDASGSNFAQPPEERMLCQNYHKHIILSC